MKFLKAFTIFLLLLLPNISTSQNRPAIHPGDKYIGTPSPLTKNCDYTASNGRLVPTCVQGGSGAACSASTQCQSKRCDNQGSCTAGGTGAICDPTFPSSCSELSCIDVGNGYRCMPGMGTPLIDCSANRQQDCDTQKRCHFPKNSSAPQCIKGGGGLPCVDAEEDCHTAKCKHNEYSGEMQCILGDNSSGEDCRSPLDCPTPDLRCGIGGTCSISGHGARCSNGGESCAQLFCSRTTTSSGTSYTCKNASEANSSIPCDSNAALGSGCSLGDKKCGKDPTTGAATCSIGGEGAACSNPSSCDNKRCDGGLCTLGGFGKKCSNDTDCTAKRCGAGGVCAPSDLGSGFSCNSPTDCHSHFSCSTGQCIEQQGPGFSTCDPNSSESTCPKWHKECLGGVSSELVCELIPGEGDDRCERDEDCATLQQYNKCVEDPATNAPRCYAVLGQGVQECEGDSDCETTSEQRYRYDFDQSLEKRKQLISSYESGVTFGAEGASIEVTYFQDLTCGMCKAFYKKVFKGLLRDYIDTGKMRFTFINSPLIPKDSDIKIVYATKCAAKQDKYLEFIDSLFDLSSEAPRDIASKIKLNLKEYDSCMRSKEVQDSLKREQELATSLNVKGTPTIYINGEDFSGFRPYEEWRKKLSEFH